jgi:hypothetical protein
LGCQEIRLTAQESHEIIGYPSHQSEWKHRDNLYQRNLKAKGHMGKHLATLDRLDDIAEEEKALESKSTSDLTEY